jgi:RNA polymerase sigma factor (sigma-70 family)
VSCTSADRERERDNARVVTSDPAVQRLIRREAWQLAHLPESCGHDCEDWRQELFYRLLRGLPAFDPQRGHIRAFATTVIRTAVRNILRELQAEKRGQQQLASLNVPIRGGGDGLVELSDTLHQPQQDARRGLRPRGDGERAQLALDVQSVLTRLPPNLHSVAEPLMRGTVSESARELGVPRTTLSSWVAQLRPYFERAGLHEYLEVPSSPRAHTV